MRKTWHAYILIVLILASCLLVAFTGCAEKEPEPLRICVDVLYINNYLYDEPFEKDMEYLVDRIRAAGGPEDIEIEILPAEGSEREATVDRIRTEIMSGEGPDVFIVSCDEKNKHHSAEALFTMPEKAFNLAWFLPLDVYMENNTQFAVWDKMQPVVLEAGNGEEGQQIIPLCYTIPVSVYHQEEVTHTPSKEITWMDMLESEDEALAAAAVWTDNMHSNRQGMPFGDVRTAMTEFILGEIADYETEELLFTEEELRQRINEIFELADRYIAGEFDSAPAHYNEYLGREFNESMREQDYTGAVYDLRNGIMAYDPLTLIPLYSDDGGVTAKVAAFTAINRNTERPEDAYFVVDYLCSRTAQSTEGLYLYLYNCGSNNLSMYTDLMNKENSVYRKPKTGNGKQYVWYMYDHSYPALCAARDQITNVQFRDTLDIELDKLYMECVFAGEDKAKRNEIIADYYRRMQQLLRE